MAGSLYALFENHLDEVLKKHFMPDDLFILGVSGGPDSMALMYLLHKLQVRTLIVHVNYGKRGEQSDLDQELTEQMAFEWGFECCTIPLDPEGAGGENFQNWAREQRYDFFRSLRDEYEAAAIVTAHHQDDQVETILQKLLRGSAPQAWQGMAEWDGELLRPLLPFTKQQVLDYCEEENIPFRTDQSNLESSYARNFLRNELAEKMDERFPGWQQNILDLQQQGARFDAAIGHIAGQLTAQNKIKLEAFIKLPRVLKSSVLKYILERAGLEQPLSKGEWHELSSVEELQTGKSLRAGNLKLTRSRGYIVIHPEKKKKRVETTFTRAEAEKGFRYQSLEFGFASSSQKKHPLNLDADKLQWPLSLRHWKAGDRFVPLGMEGSQKVSRHLMFRKIPAHLKQKALVLCGSDSTIYAIIYPAVANNGEQGAVAEYARYDSETQTFLTINIL